MKSTMMEHVFILGPHATTPDYNYDRGEGRGSGRTFRAVQYAEALMRAGADVTHLSPTRDMARMAFKMCHDTILAPASDFGVDVRRMTVRPSQELCRIHKITDFRAAGSLRFIDLNLPEHMMRGMGPAIIVPDHSTRNQLTHEHQRDMWRMWGHERVKYSGYVTAYNRIEPPQRHEHQ